MSLRSPESPGISSTPSTPNTPSTFGTPFTPGASKITPPRERKEKRTRPAPRTQAEKLDFLEENLQKALETNFGGRYSHVALTGSGAIWFGLHHALTITQDQEILRRIQSLLEELGQPNDLDFCVTTNGERFQGYSHMPMVILNGFWREQKEPYRSCTFSDERDEIDIIYCDTFCFLMLGNIPIAIPSVIRSTYEESLDLEDFERKGKNDRLKIEALNLLDGLFGNFEKHSTGHTQDDRHRYGSAPSTPESVSYKNLFGDINYDDIGDDMGGVSRSLF